jgi:hypothetical protein
LSGIKSALMQAPLKFLLVGDPTLTDYFENRFVP